MTYREKILRVFPDTECDETGTPKKVKTYEDVYRERIKEAFPELDVNHVKDELMIAAEKEMEKCGVAINNQKHEIDALKKHVAELKKELSEREAAAAVLGDYMDIKISLLGSPQKTERWGKDGVL